MALHHCLFVKPHLARLYWDMGKILPHSQLRTYDVDIWNGISAGVAQHLVYMQYNIRLEIIVLNRVRNSHPWHQNVVFACLSFLTYSIGQTESSIGPIINPMCDIIFDHRNDLNHYLRTNYTESKKKFIAKIASPTSYTLVCQVKKLWTKPAFCGCHHGSNVH